MVWSGLADARGRFAETPGGSQVPLLFLDSRRWRYRFAPGAGDILARLEDARIARLYDAGVTGKGSAYLALEYVEGEGDRRVIAITMAGPFARGLRLFQEVLRQFNTPIPICGAPADLKPSNILVTNAGQVRLLTSASPSCSRMARRPRPRLRGSRTRH